MVNGSSSNEGRVEVFHGGRWGTVCDDLWDRNDAKVVCREMGFPGAIAVRSTSYFGQGLGTIWLSNVRCRGHEESLKKCPHTNRAKYPSCHHGKDAGVVCEGMFDS